MNYRDRIAGYGNRVYLWLAILLFALALSCFSVFLFGTPLLRAAGHLIPDGREAAVGEVDRSSLENALAIEAFSLRATTAASACAALFLLTYFYRHRATSDEKRRGVLAAAESPATGKVESALPAVSAMASVLFAYIVTLAPEVGRGDSAELALIANQLGATHPPGYPIHTLLGHVFGWFFAEPAVATNALSLTATVLAIGLLSRIIYGATRDALVSFLVPVLLGFTPQVWRVAVSTEVHNVNLLMLGLSLFFALQHHREPTVKSLVLLGSTFGLSLGSYFANLLLAPAFVLLLLITPGKRWRSVGAFCLLVGAMGLLKVAFDIALANHYPPIGTRHLPGGLWNTILYVSGAQYGTTTIPSLEFYSGRIVQHAGAFSRNFLYVAVIFGAVGLYRQWRRERSLALFLTSLFLINMGYFSGYRMGSYQSMVTPSYFVFAIWIASGLSYLRREEWKWTRRVATITIVALVCGLLLREAPSRLRRANPLRQATTEWALESLSLFPENSVVASGWLEFTTLLYFQTTRELRDDLAVIQASRERRYYKTGIIEDYERFLASRSDRRPIVIHRRLEDRFLGKGFDTSVLSQDWLLLVKGK